MKRSNKKGFTTVELVIVITVIAILAAVLIPTFSNLIEKANQSADVQGARQMDEALQAESAVEKPADLKAVIEILDEAGFNIESLKPITKGHTFYWDNQLNKIMLVENETETVLYPEDATYIEANAKDLMSGKGFIKLEAATAEDVVEALTSGQSVTLTEDVELTAPIAIPAGADVTVDLNGKTLTTTESTPDNHEYAYYNHGTVTIENGTVLSRGIRNFGKMTIKNAVVHAVDPNGGACVRNESGAELVIDGGTFKALYNDTTAAVSANKPNVLVNYGSLVINDGTFEAYSTNYAIRINAGSTAIINGGTFSGYRGAIAAIGGTLEINGGTFEHTGPDRASHALCSTDGEVTINGGSFSTACDAAVLGIVDGGAGTITVKSGVVLDGEKVTADYEVG